MPREPETTLAELAALSSANAEAEAKAWNDARFFGTGYLMVMSDGRWIPIEAISLDRGKLLEIK